MPRNNFCYIRYDLRKYQHRMSVMYFYAVFASYSVVEISIGLHKNASLSHLSNYRSQSPVFFFIVMFRHSTGCTLQSQPDRRHLTSPCYRVVRRKLHREMPKIHVVMCLFNFYSINQHGLCDDCHATRSTADGRRVGGRPPRPSLLSLISLHSTRCT